MVLALKANFIASKTLCGGGRIRTYSAETMDLQSIPPLQLRRTP